MIKICLLCKTLVIVYNIQIPSFFTAAFEHSVISGASKGLKLKKVCPFKIIIYEIQKP